LSNGMVERFNDRISDTHFLSGEDLAETLRALRLPVQQSTAHIGFEQSDARASDAKMVYFKPEAFSSKTG